MTNQPAGTAPRPAADRDAVDQHADPALMYNMAERHNIVIGSIHGTVIAYGDFSVASGTGEPTPPDDAEADSDPANAQQADAEAHSGHEHTDSE